MEWQHQLSAMNVVDIPPSSMHHAIFRLLHVEQLLQTFMAAETLKKLCQVGTEDTENNCEPPRTEELSVASSLH